MAVSGLPDECENHAACIGRLALDMIEMADNVKMGNEPIVSTFARDFWAPLHRVFNLIWFDFFLSPRGLQLESTRAKSWREWLDIECLATACSATPLISLRERRPPACREESMSARQLTSEFTDNWIAIFMASNWMRFLLRYIGEAIFHLHLFAPQR